MKIGVIAHTAFGSDARVRQEAGCLAERGDQVDLFCLRQAGEEKYEMMIDRIHVYRIAKYRKPGNAFLILCQLLWFFVVSFFRVTYHYFQKRYDIIHVHTVPDFEIFAAWIPKLFGARLVLDIHDILPEFYMRKFHVPENHGMIRFIKFVEKISIQFADAVIVASPFFKELLLKRAVPAEKCATIINLPNPKYFPIRDNGHLNRNGKLKLVYPGTLSALHGVDITIRALRLVCDEHSLPVEFHIYGSGAEREKLAALVNALKLQNQVIFHAQVPIEELGKILQTMDVGIVSKRNGTFAEAAMSTKLFEFAAVGLPAIVSRTKSDQLYFDDSMVLFFEPENERQLADGILKLAQNPAHREALSKNVQSAFDRINWELVKKDFCAVFDRLYLNQAY